MTAAGSLSRAFEADGFAGPIRILGAGETDAVRRQFDALEAAEGREKCQIGLLDRHFDQRFVWELATHPAILDSVEAVLGPDLMLLATHFFCKYPAADESGETADEGRKARDESYRARRLDARLSTVASAERYVAWHQDVTYWGLEPPHSITAWYAVDDSDEENGCMRAIPGTHGGGIREHGKAEREGNLLSINQEVPVTGEEELRAADLVLRAGEISLHHGMVIHGSNPNRSTRRRCGLTLRYVSPAVRQVTLNSQGRGYTAILVRGVDRVHHFEERPRPF
jgi:hypothetical protein